ncbi:MAG: leucyl aminopeptidase [Lewinellaceae bacterium]|nr:leucyl aminopeptidase [Lewinella sp.]MCB9281528.1 leucyl aminopeptidase [Lewinellaceae bacterium]
MKLSIKDTQDLNADTTLIPLDQNSALPETLNRLAVAWGIAPAILHKEFKADNSEVFAHRKGEARYFLLGLGKDPGYAETLRACRSFSHKFKQKLNAQLTVDLLTCPPRNPEQAAEAVANGLLLGTYQIGAFKSEKTEEHPLASADAALTLVSGENIAKAARTGMAVAETQMRIFDLVNAPSNKKLPTDLGAWAIESGRTYGYRVEVWDKKKIVDTGLHALLAVNQGSAFPPAFIIMEYVPEGGSPKGKIAVVGKGVTFDTGGLSIKPAANMHLMKSDMGGAAAVLGAMETAAKLKLPVHLIGIVPSTENSVDALAVKPSDVIDSYSGKTIEVIDTDAEGRLILADGLFYAVRHFQPDILIDLATLTGSAVRTFGYHAAALFANNDALAEQLTKAGDKVGERVWRLPIWDVYKEDIKSDIADVRNYSGRPTAGAIGAAKFLEAFIDNHPAWAHLDIAGVAFNDSEFATQKSATAFGIRLLIEYFENFANN